MENIKEKLEKIGISGKEADIYLNILKMKKATVIQLSRSTDIKRTSVYHCLDGLMDKGLVNKVDKDNKKYYYAEDPQVSLDGFLQEKKNVINTIAPELKNLFGSGSYDPEIKIYRNSDGMRKMITESLQTKEKVIRYFVEDVNVEELTGEDFVNDFVKKRISLGIKGLSLRSFKYKPEREKNVVHAKQLREVRFVPENVIIKPYIAIYDDKVVVISSKEERLGFVIKSKEFAEAQKAIFDLIWNSVAI